MAAITIKLGVQSDVNPLEHELAQEPAPSGIAGLGDLEPSSDPVAQAALAQSHAAIVNMAYLRRACEEVLEGRAIALSFEQGNVWLNLDRPLVEVGPAWNPSTNEHPKHSRFQLLSWTSKMGTPSFSIPAGAPSIGGACPGASGGQTLVPLSTRKKQMEEVEAILGVPVDPARAICQHCYAEGGQYSTGQVQYAQLMRFAWVQQAVADGTFAQVMSWAIKNANFYLDGRGREKAKDENGNDIFVSNRGERDGRRYFRIHDSGDFYAPEYLAAWKAVADDNPDVLFWAPTRIWAVRALRDAVNVINNPPRNLILRPSAYSINEPCPGDLGPGWAAGSTVYADAQKPDQLSRREGPPYQWDCQAYQTDNDKVTCRDARFPGGGQTPGCRACWKHGLEDEHGRAPGLVVNYTLH